MFAARLKAASGTKARATLVVEYVDERDDGRVILTQTYSGVDVSTQQKFDAWIAAVVRLQLVTFKNAEEDAALQRFVGTKIDAI